ncbi:MAG: hypothetical protein Kow0065_08730 [Methylomicrobium sp.]
MRLHEKRSIIYSVTTVVLILGGFLLREVAWQGSSSLHTLMELVATLLAFFVGILALIRFFSRRDALFLYIGAGFLGTALLDGFHTVVTSDYFQPYMPSDNPHLVPWSWIASRLFLSVMMYVSWFLWFKHRNNQSYQPNVEGVLTFTAIATLGAFLFFGTVPLAAANVQLGVIQRPAELLPATFFSLALWGYLRKGWWRDDPFEHWIVLSLIVGLGTQIVFMPFSEHLYDTEFNLAHLLKKLSYISVLIGLLTSLYQTYKELQEEMAKRERVEKALRFWQFSLDQAKEEVYWIGENAQIFDANKAACESLNYSYDEITRLHFGDVDPIFSMEKWTALWQEIKRNGSVTFESMHKASDGKFFPTEIIANYFEYEGKGYSCALVRNITERKLAEAKLQETKELLSSMTAAVPGVVYQFVVTPSGKWKFPFISKGVEDLYEVSVKEVLQDHKALSRCILPEDNDSHRNAIQHSADTLTVWEHEHRIKTPNGNIKWVLGRAIPQRMADGSILWNGILTDITEKKKIEESLRLSASVFAHAQENIMITDADSNIVDVNAAFTRDTGYSRDEVLGKNPRILKSGYQNGDFYRAMWQSLKASGHWTGELWNRHKSGDIYAVLLTITAVSDDRGIVTHYVGISADITHIKKHQQELENIAHHDALTGLPNRILLADRMHKAIEQSKRNKQLIALCYLDLDGFKPINDSLGHEAGDQVLIEIAKRINDTIRGGDTVARLGGDEFVILLLGLDAADEYQPILDRLLKAISLPIDISGKQVFVSASIGVSLFSGSFKDPDMLLRQADQAMYSAKQSGKNQYQHYTDTPA